jgi:hypothetical protein
MSDPVFVVQLDDNLYIDETGTLQTTVPSTTRVYSSNATPDLKKLSSGAKNALKDVGNALNSDNLEDSRKAFTTILGAANAEEVIQVLQLVGKVASLAAKVVVVAGVAIAVAEILGFLKTKDDSINALIEQRFAQLKTVIDAETFTDKVLDREKTLNRASSVIVARRNTVEREADQLNSPHYQGGVPSATEAAVFIAPITEVTTEIINLLEGGA